MRITDLFIAGSRDYSEDQIKIFDDVFSSLVAAVEGEARTKLSHYVATKADAPITLTRTLAFDDDIAVAGPILSRSASIGEADLVTSAQTKGQGHLYAIACRKTISEAITEVLVDRGERRVVHTVAKNPGARLSETGFSKLIARAGQDEVLARHIGMRSDIPRHQFIRLLNAASASVREKLQAANPRAADLIDETVVEVVERINQEVRNRSPSHRKAKTRVNRLSSWDELSESALHAAARSQKFEQTVVTLSSLARIPVELAEQALLDKNYDTLLLIAKATGCAWATVKCLLTMTAAGRRLSVMDIAEVQKKYERLKPRTAMRVLQFYEARRMVHKAKIGRTPSVRLKPGK
jgi:uncharacterized protein (DUF2336 family)